MTPGGEVVIEADPTATAAAGRGVVATTWLAAAAIGVLIVVRQPVLSFVVPILGFALWRWGRAARAVEPVPTALLVGPDRIAYRVGPAVTEARREDVRTVRVEDRWLGRVVGTQPVLVVGGVGRTPLLEVTLWDRPAAEAALRQHRWSDG